jgi:hypothetical protein
MTNSSFTTIRGSLPRVFSAGTVRLATWLDLLLFIPVYLSFLALLVVYARRGLRYSPQNGRAAAIDLLTSALPLVLLAMSDIMEDIVVFVGVDAFGDRVIPWVQALTVTKFVLLGLMIVYLLIAGLLSLKRRAGAAAPPVAGPTTSPQTLAS